MKRQLMGMFLAGAAALGVAAAEAPERTTLNLLSVGNSFSSSAAVYLGKVAESAGCGLVYEHASLGGCSLERHWQLVEACEADPELKPYSENGVGFTLKEKLQSRQWDVVTIQQASHESWRPESFEPYAEKLRDFILEYAPGAEVVIQQTWSYAPDDLLLAGWGIDQTEMYRKLTANYVGAARKLGLRLIPMGLAVQIVRMSSVGTFPKLEMISGDHFHLSRSGQYLQACVWFAGLYGRDAREIGFAPPELAADEAAYLRNVAAAALTAMPDFLKGQRVL